MTRIGFGYDIHRLTDNRDLILGGVRIPYPKGLLGHSDADVLLHAICDALLGAAALRDIGYHFPDSDGKFKDIDSKKLLSKVMELVDKAGYRLCNIDTTICAEKPKLNGYIPQIQQTIAEILNTDSSNISIKATTNERLGFVGREEGIAAYAVALIETKTE